jgi:hypothetical protein
MYFKSTVKTADCGGYDDFCHYGSAFLAVYVMFVGGVDTSLLTTETSYNLFWLSLFYSFLFAIVMLNILVAVIFDAWGEVSPQGRYYFWRYRHSFLVETSETAVGRVFRGVRFSCLDALDAHIQSKTISFAARPNIVHESSRTVEKLCNTVLFFLEAVYLFIWCCLGLTTAGILWPGVIRRRICVVAVEGGSKLDETQSTSQWTEKAEEENSLQLQMKKELEVSKETTELELKALRASFETSMDEMKQILVSLQTTKQP